MKLLRGLCLLAAAGLPLAAQAGSDARLHHPPADAFFGYQVKTFREVGGRTHYARWELTNRWGRPLRVGTLKARYRCSGTAVERTHYFNKTIAQGAPTGHLRDIVCEGVHPTQVELLDVEVRDPGDAAARSVPCPGRPAAAGRYVLDARLASKGVAQLSFANGTRFTSRLGHGFNEAALHRLAADVCGPSPQADEATLYGLMRKLKATILQDLERRRRAGQAACKRGDAQACRDGEAFRRSTKTAVDSRG